MTAYQRRELDRQQAKYQTRDSYDQALREGRAVIEAQILTLAAEYRALKAAGDDDQAAKVKQAAAKLYAQL